MNINRYRISELADKAGVTKRTIHYYMGRGLLPSPDGAGLGTTYSDEHLYRVMLIKRLQDAYLPLDEIKKRMAGVSLEDVKRSLEGDTQKWRLQEQTAEYRVSRDANGAVNTATNADINADINTAGNFGTNNIGKPGANAAGIAGIPYERLDVGLGLEIHFPAGNGKARELAETLYEYAEKVMKDR